MVTGRQLEKIIGSIYQCRKLRVINPEGTFTGAGLWIPTDRERGEDGGYLHVSSPNLTNRYSYREFSRTRRHVRHLCERWLIGKPVPSDVARAFEAIQPKTVPENVIPGLVTEFVRYLESRVIRSDGVANNVTHPGG